MGEQRRQNCGLKEASGLDPQSEIRNPKSHEVFHG